MFDLDTAIATWRASLTWKRSIDKQDRDELERHIRDAVEDGVRDGMSEEDAFRTAIRRMGQLPQIDREYRKIYWGKLRKRRRLGDELAWRAAMLKNYFTIALRLLIKQRVYAVINIFGLAVGVAFCLLLLLYVRDEITFDSGHTNESRIARLVLDQYDETGGLEGSSPYQAYPVGEAMENELSAIEKTIRMYRRDLKVRAGQDATDKGILFADPSLLSSFTIPLLRGDVETALPEPHGLILSASTAERFFPDSDPVGQTIDVRFNDTYVPVTVSGVAEDMPTNSSIEFDMIMPFERLSAEYSWIASNREQWNAHSFFVYALLQTGVDLETAHDQLFQFRRKYYGEQVDNMRASGSWSADHEPSLFRLQPLREIHMDPSVPGGLRAPSDPMYTWVLGGIALIILLLACINFTTLSIGRSASRTREIGLRKVVGADRKQLVLQFGGEALLTSTLATLFGLLLALLLLPEFNELASKSISFTAANPLVEISAALGLILLVTLLSGFYPALVLSRFRPTEVLRKQSRLMGSSRLSSLLVMVQFTLSVALVAGTVIMQKQMTFIQNANLGYDRDHVVRVETLGLDSQRLLEHYRVSLEGHSGIEGITGMSNAFSRGWSRNMWGDGDVERSAYMYRVESDFVDVMDMNLTHGRTFHPDRGTDSTDAVIVNQAMVLDYGWSDPIGQKLTGFGDEPEVIGVVEDFNFLSLRETVEPMIFWMNPDWSIGDILIQVNPASVAGAIQDIENTWGDFAPEVPISYSFLDEDLQAQYQSEARWTRIVQYASIFAILIAALGLFGLASLTVTSRTKEIGIRRVLGAGTLQIASQLSSRFVRLVLAGVVLAVPITWVAANRWLESFAYRVDVNVMVFLIAACISLAIAVFTVGFQTVRAANMNPVDSIRVE